MSEDCCAIQRSIGVTQNVSSFVVLENIAEEKQASDVADAAKVDAEIAKAAAGMWLMLSFETIRITVPVRVVEVCIDF